MVVRDLKPDSSYVFVVRAENAHGLSPASEMSESVRTLSNSRSVSKSELDSARAMLSTKTIELRNAVPLSSTSVRLGWFSSAPELVEGLYVRFRELSGGSHNYNILTVLDVDSGRYAVSNLKKFTKYEFFAAPFYKSVEGQPSNSRVAQTLEDIPSAPPEGIQVGTYNESANWIKWFPPPPQHHNGIIVGYNLEIKGSIVRTMAINASTTSVMVSNLTVGGLYSARVAALTKIGMGPYSNPIALITTQNSGALGPLMLQAWVVVLLVVLTILVLVIATGLFYLKRRQPFDKDLGHLSVPVANGTQNSKDSLWIDRGWHDDCDKDASLPLSAQPAEYAEVDSKNLQTFYNNPIRRSPNDNPTPYATTMLVPPPSWSELIPPPPTHPPPSCPKDNPPLPPPRNANAYGGSVSGSACYSVHMLNHSSGRLLPHSKVNSCGNFENHCSLGGTRKRYGRNAQSCENRIWGSNSQWEDSGEGSAETDKHSCCSSYDTTCSCSESSGLYAEAGQYSMIKPLTQCQVKMSVK